VRLGNAHIFNLKKLNKMNKEEMIEVILAYEKELIENYKENAKAFGYTDKDSERAFSKWNVIDELIERLNLQKSVR
jgi:TusA-related sulfurtransferase